jgi:hypothetical protein
MFLGIVPPRCIGYLLFLMNVVKSKMSMKFEDCRMQWMAYNYKRLKVQIININNTFNIHFLIVSLTKLGSWLLVVL